ncbi:TPA: contact-dependent growth inhibition system immunity protein [Yersinia enterocolitica]|uniref:contact-dependent growth inhibition system immunity protein n=1 Tax=Yersinia enterocolitica TaxID=630 RepID=UPI00094BA619|nr:contact-dependent growth inhibition system immunity protein [Yersinia enterocolitica]HEN3577714.1 CdiI family contact-dependent growth inhibition immunity protein [Yersinia enterocolitica]HEN3601677.1 CdiI family contact-dependent growth inhibition immunity protein [Yersinia enterocolitica]HEN3612528.1 CdiI family contact-dependent growth inhibition immunity protein [Yersinia enterocolitica]HEN3622325.1 CdiI family contact-dependent growth inhibition immunity protein [Yersinia enterocolitica
MKFTKNQDYWVSCYCNKEFLLIETLSGLGRFGSDPLFPPHLLPPDTDDQTIGEAVLVALSNSRTLSLEESADFFDLEKGKERYAAWIAMLMERYGYKTKRALFKDMKNCSIHCLNDVITISPTRHEKLEAWGGTGRGGSDKVILPVNSPPSEIGAALRLALSRCKG